jgi:hypothetical protein
MKASFGRLLVWKSACKDQSYHSLLEPLICTAMLEISLGHKERSQSRPYMKVNSKIEEAFILRSLHHPLFCSTLLQVQT